MITGKFENWNGFFALFTHDEIEVWDTPEAVQDISALAMLDEKSWVQNDICVGDWAVDCITYDPTVMPDMLIVGRRVSGMGAMFLLKYSSVDGKTGYLMRTFHPEDVVQSIFAKQNFGQRISCRLVMTERFDPSRKVIHRIPFAMEQVEIEGTPIVALTLPQAANKKAA